MTRLFQQGYWPTRTLVTAGLLSLSINLPTLAATPKTDFNGDGKADLYLGNLFSGQRAAWLINGGAVSSRPSYGTVAPSTGWTAFGIKDANADGRTDIYLYNVNTGAIGTQLVNGPTVSTRVTYGSKSRSQGWSVLGLGDYNRDRRFDFFWFNGYTGQVEVWVINGATVLQKLTLGTLPPNEGWIPVGLRDLNFDGRTDVFLYNRYTGGTGAWLIGVGVVSYDTVPPSDGWQPIGLEDFSADGKADLLWYNIYSGNIAVWLINGSVVSESVALGNVKPSTGWTLSALNDLNGDNKTDILWYNVHTGGTGTWITSNGTGFLPIGTLSPTAGWRPLGLDDFSGDRKADLIWGNVFTNATTTWLLDGSTIRSRPSYGSLPANSVWTVNIPR